MDLARLAAAWRRATAPATAPHVAPASALVSLAPAVAPADAPAAADAPAGKVKVDGWTRQVRTRPVKDKSVDHNTLKIILKEKRKELKHINIYINGSRTQTLKRHLTNDCKVELKRMFRICKATTDNRRHLRRKNSASWACVACCVCFSP